MTAFVDYYWRLPVKAYKSARPCLFKTFFCRSCLSKTALSFQDCFLHALYMILSEFHTTYLLDFWLSSPEFQIKFDRVWTCLNMSEHVWTCLDKYLIMSNHVWSTIGQHTTKFDQIVWSCLIMSNHVWSCLIVSGRVRSSFWSCLIISCLINCLPKYWQVWLKASQEQEQEQSKM
jgi:hypothetical protein